MYVRTPLLQARVDLATSRIHQCVHLLHTRADQGAERENVLQLFGLFAAMPEDVPVPTSLCNKLAVAAPELFGMLAKTKRPHLKVRSWLTALIRLSLLQGSLDSGLFMHGTAVQCQGCVRFLAWLEM